MVEGRDEGHIVDAWSVITGRANLGSNVLVADWRCDWVGMGIAEKLALAGHKVQLVVNGPHAGFNLQIYLRDYWAAKLDKLGVSISARAVESEDVLAMDVNRPGVGPAADRHRKSLIGLACVGAMFGADSQ